MEGVRKKVADLRNQLDEKDEKICALNETIEMQQRRIQEMEDDNRSFQYKVEKASVELENTEKKLEDAIQTKSQLELTYTDTTSNTRNQVDKLERELDCALNDLDNYKRRCHEAEEGQEHATREATALRAKVAKLEDELDIADERYKAVKEELDETIAQLNEI